MKNENKVEDFRQYGSCVKTNFATLKLWVYLLLIATFIPMLSFSQPIDLGTAKNFILYTSNGAIGNTGTSFVNGSMGTDGGAVSGFKTSTVNGSTEIENAVTEEAIDDVQSAYDQGAAMTATLSPDHAPAFGSGDTLLAGVYNVDGAGSLGGNPILGC